MPTEFAPAERAPQAEIHRQSKLFPDEPVVRQFMEVIPSIVTVLNRERQIVFANHRLLDWLGMKPSQMADVYGRRPGEVLACSHAFENEGGCGTTRFCSTCGAVKAILSSQAHTEDVQECRILQTPDGFALDLKIRTAPFRLGDEWFTIFVVQDISHEKRKAILERLFFHDVLNTTGGLKGATELIRGAGAGELKELHGIIRGLTDALIEEIQAQRQLVAAESNDLVLHPVVVDAAALLDEVADHYTRHDIAAGRHLQVDPNAWQGSILTDRTIFRRVVGNMVKNALEASRAGDGVSLGCERSDGEIAFWVHNPGFVSEEVQLQIFQRSFSTKGEGRGLGTYSIKLFAEQYLKGSVSFTTSRDAGTTFRVALPADCEVHPDMVPVDEKGTRQASEALRILLVDDNRVNRKVAAALLERSGHTVTICESGRKAVDLSAGQPFDLILMDIQMPEMDGIEATKAIRAQEAGSGVHTPILSMTGLTGSADQARCREAGMDGSVSKPVQPDELDGFIARREAPPAAAVGQATGPEAFAMEDALRNMGGEHDLLEQIAGIFLENDTPGYLERIRKAVAEGDAEALRQSAHALKGSCANFAAHAAVEAAAKLEQAGRNNDLPDLTQQLERLEVEMDRLVTALRAIVKG
jgi:CheY-like chemotaxis protein/nitrogen-specific signal transduction histidine kinase